MDRGWLYVIGFGWWLEGLKAFGSFGIVRCNFPVLGEFVFYQLQYLLYLYHDIVSWISTKTMLNKGRTFFATSCQRYASKFNSQLSWEALSSILVVHYFRPAQLSQLVIKSTCVRSHESKFSLSNTRKHEVGWSSINFNQIIVRPTVLLCTIDQFTNNGIQLGYHQTPLTDESEALSTRVEALVSVW